jgi:hypothetical protein
MTAALEITKSSPPPGSPFPQTPFQPQSSFTQKLLQVSVTLNPGSAMVNALANFAGGGNAVTLIGHRTSVRVSYAGAPSGSYATIRVWGVNQSLMNQLSTLGMVFDSVQRNSVIVSAGDAVSGLSPVFGGVAWQAYGEYDNMPDVPFVFTCQAGLDDATVAATPSSFTGVTDVATMMSGYARLMNKQLENNGVTAKLSNPYYGGNVWQQVQQAARDANINAEIVNGGSTLAIWPVGGARSVTNAPMPLLSPNTGMIGYPTFAGNGYLVVRHVFNPLVAFGGMIQVQSSLPQANKTWVVQKLDLALDSFLPKGEWAGVAYCQPSQFSAPVPPGTIGPPS